MIVLEGMGEQINPQTVQTGRSLVHRLSFKDFKSKVEQKLGRCSESKQIFKADRERGRERSVEN